jgi:hypothetical protein
MVPAGNALGVLSRKFHIRPAGSALGVQGAVDGIFYDAIRKGKLNHE